MVRLSVACGFFMLCALGAAAIQWLPPGHRALPYLVVHGIMTCAMLLAWRTAKSLGAAAYRPLLITGVVARVLLVPVAPYTTHDVQRYLWDGAVALHGEDPYRLAPREQRLAPLRSEFPTPPEHVAYPTLYPPAALAVFALAAALGPTLGIFAIKFMLAVASLVLLWIMARLLTERKQQQHLALVALSPLLVLEGGVGGHIDLLAACALAAGLWAWQRARVDFAGLALGCGTLLTLAPGLLLLPWAASKVGKASRTKLVAACALSLSLGYGAALLLGLRPWGSLGTFLLKWRFGSPLGAVLPAAVAPWLTVAITALGLCFVTLWARRLPPNRLAPVLLVTLVVPLLASPVLFPWYLSILVPVLALRPSWFVIAWMSAAPLTYQAIDRFDLGHGWVPAAWPLWAVAVAWVVGAALDWRQAKRGDVARVVTLT